MKRIETHEVQNVTTKCTREEALSGDITVIVRESDGSEQKIEGLRYLMAVGMLKDDSAEYMGVRGSSDGEHRVMGFMFGGGNLDERLDMVNCFRDNLAAKVYAQEEERMAKQFPKPEFSPKDLKKAKKVLSRIVKKEMRKRGIRI